MKVQELRNADVNINDYPLEFQLLRVINLLSRVPWITKLHCVLPPFSPA